MFAASASEAPADAALHSLMPVPAPARRRHTRDRLVRPTNCPTQLTETAMGTACPHAGDAASPTPGDGPNSEVAGVIIPIAQIAPRLVRCLERVPRMSRLACISVTATTVTSTSSSRSR